MRQGRNLLPIIGYQAQRDSCEPENGKYAEQQHASPTDRKPQ
jgi:hypothetical protein